MRCFQTASIRTKLRFLLALSCILTLSLVCAAFVWNDITMIESHMVRQISVLADMLGANSAEALVREDRQAVADSLASLRMESSAEFACTYDAAGKVVASFGEPTAPITISDELAKNGHAIDSQGKLEVLRPILSNDKIVGRVYIRANLSELQSQLFHYALIVTAILSSVLVACFVMSTAVSNVVLRPVIELAGAMKLVSDEGDYSLRVEKVAEDELGSLCDGFNKMLEQIRNRDADLRTLNQELVASARRAGQAEIATSVLHNVGNVLNSVNVSVSVLDKKAKEFRISGVTNVASLVSEHSDDLGRFFASDERAKRLPGYLSKLSEQLESEQSTMVSEIKSLLNNVDHIKQIIRKQQTYAGAAEVTESCSLQDLMEEALTMSGVSLERHGIHVKREYEARMPKVEVVKVRLLQILVNLIVNAKDALSTGTSMPKLLTLRIQKYGEQRVRLETVDNGIGIDEKILTTIFSYGFTTKKHGHGFGLHSAANAMRAMGGSLSASSAGPGKGACFTAELPLMQEASLV